MLNREMNRAFGALSLLVLDLALGCSGQPSSNRVQAGSTIFLPLGGVVQAFGSELTKAFGDYDDQRGELVFHLSGPYNPTTGAPDGPQSEYRLKTRFVTRVSPDPMAEIGQPGAIQTYGNEILAVVDIPPSNAPVDPGPLVTTGTQSFRVVVSHRKRVLDNGNQSYTPEQSAFLVAPPPLIGYVTIVPGVGTPTPAEAFFNNMLLYGTDLQVRLLETVPNPKVVLTWTSLPPGLGQTPSAAEVDISFPPQKLEVVSVAEHGHRGTESIVQWRLLNAGTIRVTFVSPDAAVQSVGVGFRLLDPLVEGRASLNDFQIVSSSLWDHQGVLMTPPTGFPMVESIE